MDETPAPFRRMVFVCVNAREDGRVACANPGRGGDELCRRLKEGVTALGLKGKVRVVRTGCLDLCEQGPNVVLFPEGTRLCGVSPDDAPKILERLKAELE